MIGVSTPRRQRDGLQGPQSFARDTAAGSNPGPTSRRFLVLHGFGNRRPRTHWQWWLTDQLRRRGEIVLYPQLPDPEAPILERWLELLAAEWQQLGDGERVVVCHSLACALWYQAAARSVLPEPADRVLLVAPAGSAVLSRPEMVAFLPVEWCAEVLGSSSRATIRLVASDADPCCPEGPAAEIYGKPLGLDSETVSGAGHLTSADGFGPWPKVLAWCLDAGTRFGEDGVAEADAAATMNGDPACRRHIRELAVRIDRAGGRVGRQLEDQLRGAIRSGALGAGTHLPSTRVLAEDLNISRGAVVRAYTHLASEGYLDVRRGASPRVRASGSAAQLHGERRQSVASTRSGGARLRYDLRADLPDLAVFPRAAWARSLRRSLSTASNGELADRDDRGLERLRVELAAYLSRARGVAADPERMIITAGGLQALGAVARVLGKAGPSTIAIENPCTLLLREVVLSSGLLPLPTPVDSEGMIVDGLGDADAAVVSTANHFPTGVSLSPERRARLSEWLRSGTGRLLIEDDNDGDLRVDRTSVQALQHEDPDSVVYIGSTAKTLAPVLRMGWAVLPPRLVRATAAEIASGKLHPTPIDQLAFADFLRAGDFERHLRRLRGVYQRRRELIADELRRRLPELRVFAFGAGSHVVLELPSAELEQIVTTRARSAGLVIQPLSQHALHGYAGPAGGLVIGYASLSEPTIPPALHHLETIIRAASGSTGRVAIRRTAPRRGPAGRVCC